MVSEQTTAQAIALFCRSLPATYQFNNVQWSAELPWFVKDDAEEAHILVGGDPERTLPRALAECFGASPLTIMGMLAAKTPGNLNTPSAISGGVAEKHLNVFILSFGVFCIWKIVGHFQMSSYCPSGPGMHG